MDHRPHDPRVRRPRGAPRTTAWTAPEGFCAVTGRCSGSVIAGRPPRWAPANTIQAVEAALAQGVDLVELDVFGRSDRTLVLGHSRKELGDEPA